MAFLRVRSTTVVNIITKPKLVFEKKVSILFSALLMKIMLSIKVLSLNPRTLFPRKKDSNGSFKTEMR